VNTAAGKRTIRHNFISFILVFVTVLTSMLTAFAWNDFTQSKTNVFRGTIAKTSVTLHKYEMDENGIISAVPVRGAEFELYMLSADGTDKKIGGTYTTNESGKITVEKLNSGTFKFLETKPGYGYDYVLDDKGNPITKYSFTINADDSLGQAMVEVDAYNRRLTNSLEVEKTAEGTGADFTKPFEFTIWFSNGNAYPYTINGTGDFKTTEKGKFYLRHGERAVFEGLPVGVYYQILETPDPQYAVQSTNNQGTIRTEEKSKAEFKNTYIGSAAGSEPQRTTITVEKLVTGEAPDDRAFWFDFLKNEEDPVRFSLKAGEKKSFELNTGDTYSIAEDDYFAHGYIQLSAINGTGTATGQETRVTITNQYIGTIWKTIQCEKEWELGDAPSTVMPDSIEVLLKNGNQIVETKKVTPNEYGEWLFSFTAPKYDSDGKEINYILGEIPPPGFEITISDYIITNTYTGKTNVTVNKVWNDNNNPDRPSEIKVQLYKNHEAEGSPVVLNEDNNWRHTWHELSVAYTWTADETEVPEGYSKTVSGSELTGFTITNSKPDAMEETIVSGVKTWNHGDNPAANHPESIRVHVKNGEAIVASADITSANHWSFHFRLPKYDAQNKLIPYTVDEEPVPGYHKEISGYNLINTWIPNGDVLDDTMVVISGIKTWNHNGASENGRPSSIVVYVKSGGEVIAEKTVTGADHWKYSFVLPKFEEDGVTLVSYSIEEANVPRYRHQLDGYNLINTYESESYPGDSPKTGDNANPLLWTVLLIAGTSMLGAAVVLKIKKRRAKSCSPAG